MAPFISSSSIASNPEQSGKVTYSFSPSKEISIAPKALIPERITRQSMLIFAAHSFDPVCIRLRFMGRDGEVWEYSKPSLEYKPPCFTSANQ